MAKSIPTSSSRSSQESFGELSKLQELRLAGNELSTLPDSVGKLTELKASV